jgi:hypothetical protein
MRRIPGFVLFILGVLFLAAPCGAVGTYAADPSNDELIEAPTAYTLLHGEYQCLLRMYESGGLFIKGDIGFHKFLQFGFSGNATNVIGHGDISVQEPRLAIKLKPLAQGKFPLSVAVGWDDRGYGESVGRRFTPGLQKGLYVVVSREIQKLHGLQLHAGANRVKFGRDYDAKHDTAGFCGLSFGIGHSFQMAFETDKLFTDLWQFNAGFLVGNGLPIRVGLDFRDMNRKDFFSRILRIQYTGFF